MIITGDRVSIWVAKNLGIEVDLRLTVGVGWEDNGQIIMGAAFYNYTPYNIYVHVFIVPNHRLNPGFIAAFVDYPFNQAKVRRLTGLIPLKNFVARKFASDLGGKIEGCMEQALENDDLLIYGLTRSNAERWLTAPYQRRIGVRHGKEGTVTAPCT